MRTVSLKIYQFGELSDVAKKRAREWYREGNTDNDWSDSIIEDAKNVGKLMGFDIDKVYYSGFYDQGSGACFIGTFRSSEFEAGGIQAYAPKATELHRIANEIEEIINKFYCVTSCIKHSGHYYYHENCTLFDTSITDNQDNEIDTKEAAEAEKELIKLSRDFMKWIYATLQTEYEYQNSDAVIDENIAANDYEFTEDGKRFMLN